MILLDYKILGGIRMVKVGDKVRSLANYGKTIEGVIYTVKNVIHPNRGILLYETNSYLAPWEYELIYEEQLDELEEAPESEELTNTERYKTNSGKQLFNVLEDDLLTYEELRGFYKANIYKYTHRYKQKNGIEDLKKVKVYVDQLIKLEEKQDEI